MSPLRRSSILESGVITVSGPLLVFSVYLLFAGHNQPGGGFAGGLVAGIALLLAWVAGGMETVRRVVPIRAGVLLGFGLTLAAISGFASMIAGFGFLESGYLEFSLPGVGKVKLVSALAFDMGVYLVIVGMALGLVRVLGEDETLDAEAAS